MRRRILYFKNLQIESIDFYVYWQAYLVPRSHGVTGASTHSSRNSMSGLGPYIVHLPTIPLPTVPLGYQQERLHCVYIIRWHVHSKMIMILTSQNLSSIGKQYSSKQIQSGLACEKGVCKSLPTSSTTDRQIHTHHCAKQALRTIQPNQSSFCHNSENVNHKVKIQVLRSEQISECDWLLRITTNSFEKQFQKLYIMVFIFNQKEYYWVT